MLPYLQAGFGRFLQRRRIRPPVIKLRRPRVRIVGHFPRLRQRTPILQVIGDAGRTHRVIADAGFNSRPLRMALYEPVSVLLRQPVRRAGRAPGGAEQRPVLLLADPGRRNIVI